MPVFALRIDASGVVRGSREAQSSISSITNSAGDAAKSLVDLRGVLAGLGAGFSLAQVTKEFATFQSAVVNIGKVSNTSLDVITAKLKSIDAALGSSTQLAEGYYQAMSAGITDSVKAIDMLTVASKTAKAAGISQAETINALAKAMNGYSGELKTAEQAANMFFTIEKLGMTTVSELAPVMGDLAGVAKTLGISYNDLGGSMALITQTSGSTSTAATRLNGLLMEMTRPSENLQKVFKEIGVASGEALIRSKGWPDALKAIEEQAKKMGLSMGSVFGSQEGYQAFIKLMEDGFGKLRGYSDEVKTSTDSMSSAWGRYTKTINGQLDEMANRMSNIAVITGESFGGTTLAAIQMFNGGLDSLAQNFDTVKSGAVALGAGIVALTATKKISLAVTQGLNAEDVRRGGVMRALGERISLVSTSEQQRITGLIETNKATLNNANAELTSEKARLRNATAARTLAQAEVQRTQTLADSYRGSQYAVGANRELETAQRRLTAANDSAVASGRAIVAARGRVTAATNALNASMVTASGVARGLGSSLLGAFGGPVGIAVTAAAVGIAYFSTKQSEAEKIGERYAKVSSEIEEVLKRQANAAKGTADEIEQLSLAQKRLARDKAIEDQATAFQEMQSLSGKSWLGTLGVDGEDIESIKRKTLDLLFAIRTGKGDIAGLALEIDRLGTKSSEAAQLAGSILSWLAKAEKAGKTAEGAFNILGESTGQAANGVAAVGNAAAGATANMQSFLAALDKSVSLSAQPQSLEDAVVALEKYTGNTNLAAKQHEELEKSTVKSSLAMLAEAEALARASGNMSQAAQIAAATVNFQARIASGVKTSASGVSKTATAAASALKSITDELAKLQMTDAGYQKWQVNQKVSEMEKVLGKANPKVIELRSALGKELEDKFFKSIQEYANPAQAALGKVKEQYDNFLDTVNKSAMPEAQKNIFNTQIVEQYEKALAGVGGTSQNLVKVNRDMQKQEAELSGNRTLWWEIRKQEVYEETEAQISLADTSTIRAVADKKLQLERMQKEGENAGGFAKLWEETYKRVDEAGVNMIEGFLTGSKNGLDGLKNMFTRTLAEMANAAVLRPITVSMMGVMGGTIGGMVGGGNAYANGMGMGGMNGMGGTGGFGMSNMPVGSMIPNSWTSGISDSINNTMSAWFPKTFAANNAWMPGASSSAMGMIPGGGIGSGITSMVPSAGLPTLGTSFLGALGAGGMGFGIGSLAGSLLFPDKPNISMGSGIGGGLGAAIGSIVPGIGTLIGGGLGSLLGGGLGSLFGSKKPKRPAVTGSLNLDLGNADAFDSYDFMRTYDPKNYGKGAFQVTEKDYFTTASRDRNNAGQESAKSMQTMLDAVASSAVIQAQAVQNALPKVYAKQFSEQLSKNRINQTWDLKGKDISEDSFKQIAEDIQKKVNDSMLISFQGMDFSEYANRLKIDQSSLEGLNTFTTALSQMDSMMQTIDLAKNPLSDVEQQAKAVIAQVETWQKELGGLGWSSAEAAKADEYRTVAIDNMMKGVRESLHPMSQWEQQAKAQVEQIEDMVSALTTLNGAEAQIAEVESLREKAIGDVMKVINESISPVSELEQQTKAAIAQADDWNKALAILGVSQDVVTAKTNAYKNAFADNIIGSIDALISPISEIAQQAKSAAAQIEEWNKALAILGVPLEEATAKTEAYRNAVVGNLIKSIDGMISPISEVEQQAKSAAAQIDEWNKALVTLGMSQDVATAKTDAYRNMLSGDMIKSISDIIAPTAQYATVMAQANKDIDTRIAALRALGSSEQQIAELEAMRGDYLAKSTESMRKAYEDDVEARWAVVYGTGEATKLAMKQAQEMHNAIEQWGAGSWRVDELKRLQQAENAQSVYNKAQSEYNSLLEKMKSLQQKAAQEEIKALNDKHNEAQKLFDTYSRLAETLKDARISLWTSDTNMLGTSSREEAAQIEFDRLYGLAMSGDADAASKMEGVGKELLDLKKLTSVNSEEYMSAFYDVDKRLREAQVYAMLQVTEQEKQLNVLNASLEAAQKQQEAIVNNGVLLGSLAEQQTALAAQLAAADAALLAALKNLQVYAPGAGGGGSGSSSSGGGSKPLTWEERILQDKANSMNSGNTLSPGQSAGGWTPDKVKDEMEKVYGSVDEWYKNHGKLEGFARGGITPANKPFLVGEQGAELMMSPYQYGVMSNPDTQKMLDRAMGGSTSVHVQSDGGMNAEIRMLRMAIEELVRQNTSMHRMQEQMVVALSRIERHTLGTTDALDEALAEGMPVNIVGGSVRTQ